MLKGNQLWKPTSPSTPLHLLGKRPSSQAATFQLKQTVCTIIPSPTNYGERTRLPTQTVNVDYSWSEAKFLGGFSVEALRRGSKAGFDSKTLPRLSCFIYQGLLLFGCPSCLEVRHTSCTCLNIELEARPPEKARRT